MYENITFESILERMLERVPETMDKREGSVVYDALAPAAIELQLMYIELDHTLNESFADTASREYLIKRAGERGLTLYEEKKAIVRGAFLPSSVNVPLGSRFNLNEINYVVTEKISEGQLKLQCETAGVGGNLLGTLIPIEEIENLESVSIVEVLIPGEEAEDTEAFRKRYYDSFDLQSYGGNIADYKMKTNALDGVGECKVYPAWSGGGTVKLVIMDSAHQKPSGELINAVQTAIDPEPNKGEGYGIAPIGHVVTVVGVDEKEINIQSAITFDEGSTLESAIGSLRKAVDNYFISLREGWQDAESLVVRISQIEYNLLECSEVLDISDTKINAVAQNLILGADEIPKRGTINGV